MKTELRPNCCDVEAAVSLAINTDTWLEGEAYTSGQVAEVVAFPEPYVRTALDILVEQGELTLVEAKKGKYRHYRLSDKRVDAIGPPLSKSFWEQS